MFTIQSYNYILLIKIKCKKLLKVESPAENVFTITILYNLFEDGHI